MDTSNLSNTLLLNNIVQVVSLQEPMKPQYPISKKYFLTLIIPNSILNLFFEQLLRGKWSYLSNQIC